MSDIGDNRLAVLAREIRIRHAGVKIAAEVASEHAIAAGNALIEAKALVAHGQWLPWLDSHCGFSERTAQLYMRIAEKGMDPSIVAALALKGAATAFEVYDPDYNPFAGCDAEAKLTWLLFACWVGGWQHTEWVINKQFASPDEWLGPVGEAQRKMWGMRPLSAEARTSWDNYLAEQRFLTQEEVERRLAVIEERNSNALPAPKTRRRRKSATVTGLQASTPPQKNDLGGRLRMALAQGDLELQRAEIAAIAAELDGACA